MNFNEAKRRLDTPIWKAQKKLEYQTWLVRKDDGNIAIRLFETDIITFKPNGDIILNSGGWRTATTKERMNKYANCHIIQRNGIWYISNIPFKDGMVVKPDGGVVGGGSSDDVAKVKILSKKIREYAKIYVKKLFDGKIPAPSGGDCWGCYMKDQDGKDVFGNEHLISHLNEKYYVPSLLYNATTECSVISKLAIYNIWHKGGADVIDQPFIRKEIERAIIRYMKSKLLIAN